MAFVPKSRSEVHDWLVRFHDVGDKLDYSRASTIYARNARVQFGNLPAFEGVDAIQQFFKETWARLSMMKHVIAEYDMVGNDKIYQSCHITWQIRDDPAQEVVKVPAMAVYHLEIEGEETGLIAEAEFYMDPSPLMTALGRVSV